MSPEAQRVAIAQACGYKQWPSSYGTGQLILARSRDEADTVRLGEDINGLAPSYLTDLNAMHEAEKMLIPAGGRKLTYTAWLTDLMGKTETPSFDMIHATAAQKAEAFLRTKGLWTGGEAATNQ